MIKKKKVVFETSKSGASIIRLTGRYLSSPSDPEREAIKWCNRNQDLFFSEYIIVLGAGSGYHLMELVRQRPNKKIIVIEPFREVIAAVKEIHRHIFMLGIEFININSIREIYSCDLLKEALKNHYSVVDYNLNVYQNDFLNFELIEFLNARSMEGLHFVAGLRGYLNEEEEQEYDRFTEEQSVEGLIGINNIDDIGFDPFTSDEMKWKKKVLSKLIGGKNG